MIILLLLLLLLLQMMRTMLTLTMIWWPSVAKLTRIDMGSTLLIANVTAAVWPVLQLAIAIL